VGYDFMTKRMAIYLAAFLCVAAVGAAAQSSTGGAKAWSGTIVYSSCNADEAFNESAECFREAAGAKLALYDDTNRVMYSLEPQEKIAGQLGHSVTVRGTLDEDTIRVVSIEPLSVGLAVGQKAPAFSARDQLGRVQTLETLKGPNGTVVLFFRSADW
jgi:nitrogen fixation protein FixH